MATAPQSRRLNLTRDQLSQFLTDQQQIRQFELLFATVDELQVITGTDFEYQADTAAATANEALAQLSALAQDTAVDQAVLNAKVQQALDAISGLAKTLEMLALAPRQELGTIASQNSDNVNITGGLVSGLDAPLPVASGGIGVTTAPANQVFAGPTAGSAAAPAFRSLVVADIPALPYGTGDVVGPASATDNAVARFDSTTGKLIQNSVTTIDDTGNASGILSQQFSNGSAVTLAAGKMWYDGSTGSWNLGMGGGNITQQVGEEQFIYGKASAAITDSPLRIVYHTGTVGSSGVIQFAPTIAGITDINAIVGVATENIPLNGFGRITTFGVVRGITTNGTAYGEVWADDDVIWYNPVTGNPTKVEPSAPNIKIQVGIVINAGSGGSGSFQVLLRPGSKLGGTDSNVQFSALANNNLIQYDSTLQYWKNVTPASVTGVGSVSNAVTFNNSGAGAASGTTFDGSVARTISYNTIGAQAAGTYVTSVTGTSPVASSGGTTPAISLATGYGDTQNPYASKTANYFLAAPNGSAGAPTFRAMVAADVPALSYVSSVSATAPITSSGGLTPTIGVTSAALTKTDDTNITMTLGGTPASALLAATSMTLGWTGTLAVSRGGIGTGTAGIGAFNNITGYTASGATGTTSTNLVFSTSPTLTTPKATTTIGVGNATPSASGAGISFPATQSASTDPNTLDDYEEGTWTATLKGFSTAGTYQLVNNDNYYTKIGNKVFLQCRIRLDTITGGGAGFAVISGLPFSKRSASMAVGALWHINVDYPAGALTGSPCVSFYTFSSSSELYFPLNISGSISEISITGFNSFDYMNFSIDYEVS